MADTVVPTNQNLIGLLERHAKDLRTIGVVRIGMFGSHVRGEAESDSDIDILVTLADDRFKTFANVKIFLEELFEQEVDLVIEDALRKQLRPHILREVVYAEGV